MDSGLGGEPARRSEGVQAEADEFVRRDIIPDLAGLGGIGQHATEELVEMPLRSGEVLVLMNEGG
jgi:hypothetical protein